MDSKTEMEENPPMDYLRISCFVVAALELFHSLTLAFNSIYELSLYQNVYNVLAYLNAMVYVLTVKALIVGLWKGIPKLLTFWFIFAALATVTSIVFLIWNILASPIFNREHYIQWSIVYLGIIYECTCLLLIFSYYKKCCPYSLLEGCNYCCSEKDLEKNNQVFETKDEEESEEYENKSQGKH